MITLAAASDAVLAVGVTLVNFLWQAALVGLVTAAVLAACPRATAATRYALACLGLLVMAAAPVGTFLLLAGTPAVELVTPGTVAASSQMATVLAGAAATAGLTDWLPGVVSVWAIGVLLLTARLGREWWQAERVRRIDVQPVPDALELAVRRLAAALGVRRRVTVVESPWIDVPAVIGWLRPTILFPIGALTGLSWQQIEALLAHELAHVRRHDHLVNALQSVVETLFFFHPAVWWISRQVRIEREHCCDDAAVAACGSAVAYARALATLEETRLQHLSMALAATDGSLLSRIRRLVGHAPTDTRERSVPIAVCVALIMAAVSFASGQARALSPGTPDALHLDETVFVGTAAPATDASPRGDLAIARHAPAPAPRAESAIARHPLARAQEVPVVVPPVAPPPPPPAPVRVGGNIREPRKVVNVPPVYPDAAREAGIQGIVILEATIDPEGTVSNLRVLRSIPDLDQAAINAVRQWRYTPSLLNGEPVAVIMTVTVNFTLTPSTRTAVSFSGRGVSQVEPAPAGAAAGSGVHAGQGGVSAVAPVGGPLRVGGGIRPPMKVHSVPPVYPKSARDSNVSGMVVLEALIDPAGNVTDVSILRSVPMLDQAAIDAVRQWQYTPTLLNGAPVSVVMTVTVNFTLH